MLDRFRSVAIVRAMPHRDIQLMTEPTRKEQLLFGLPGVTQPLDSWSRITSSAFLNDFFIG
jgi:hypothetical protein